MDVPHGSAATAVDTKTTGDHHRRDGDDASMGSADAVPLDASTAESVDDGRDTATAVAPFAVHVAPADSEQERDDSGSGGGGPRGCPRPGDVCAPCHRGFTPLQRLYAVLALNQVAEAGWGWFVYLFAFVRGAHGLVALTLFYCALSGTALLTAVGMGTQHHRTPDLADRSGRRGRGLSGHLVLAGASACKAACIVLVLAAAADDGTGAPPSGSLPLLLVSGMVYGVCLGAFWCTYHGLFLTTAAAAQQPQQQPHHPPFHEPSTSVASTAPVSSSAPPVHAAAAAPARAVGTVFALAGLCGALVPVLAGALLDLCDGVYTPLFLIAASVALTNAVGLVRLSQRPDTVPVQYGPGLDTLKRGRALLPMLVAEGLCASVVQFVPILVSLRLAALTDRGLYFGAFQGGLSALTGAGALVATPRRTGRPLTVACAFACAGLLAAAYAAGGAYPDSVALWSVACGTMTLTYGWLATLTGTRVVQSATVTAGLTAVQAMWLREVVFGGARCVVGLVALVVQVVSGPGDDGADLSALFVGAACGVVVLWMCWQRHIRAATLARAVAHLQQQQQQQQQPPRAGDGDAAAAPTV